MVVFTLRHEPNNYVVPLKQGKQLRMYFFSMDFKRKFVCGIFIMLEQGVFAACAWQVVVVVVVFVEWP